MKQTQEFDGKNIDHAVEKACSTLNVSKKKLVYDVISSGSTGIFGIVGVKKAKIRVTLPKKNTGTAGERSAYDSDMAGVMSIVDEAFGEGKNKTLKKDINKTLKQKKINKSSRTGETDEIGSMSKSVSKLVNKPAEARKQGYQQKSGGRENKAVAGKTPESRTKAYNRKKQSRKRVSASRRAALEKDYVKQGINTEKSRGAASAKFSEFSSEQPDASEEFGATEEFGASVDAVSNMGLLAADPAAGDDINKSKDDLKSNDFYSGGQRIAAKTESVKAVSEFPACDDRGVDASLDSASRNDLSLGSASRDDLPLDSASRDDVSPDSVSRDNVSSDAKSRDDVSLEEYNDRDEGYPPKYKGEIPVDVSKEAVRVGLETLEKMISLITDDAAVAAETDEDRLLLRVEGGNSGVLIGRRGQTLEAMQFLTDKIINRHSESRVRLKVDIEGYMETRKANLKSLAYKMADKAKKTGRPATINQMTAQDRRIVHLALKDDYGVRTQSMGDGYYRRLVIFPKKSSYKRKRNFRK